MSYQILARYYDEIFGPLRGPLETAREHVLKRIMPRVGSACDLACGTGTTALLLARKGIKTYAVDGSPGMCRAAREKVRRAGLPVRVLRQDMRKLRLPEQVDLILCEGDAINHLPRKQDLQLVAKGVAQALRPGGYFFFDVNNAPGFKRYWTGTACFEKPGVVLIMRNAHSGPADRAWSEIDFFIRDGGCWRRRHERVDEISWDPGEIRRAFQEAGFERPLTWDATPFFKGQALPISTGCRTIYLARRHHAG